MKKPLVVLFAALGAAALSANTHSLVKQWETEATLKVPESVLFDAERSVLYVSNIDGEPWKDDGRGSIAKVGLDGKIVAVDWVTGLSAPKGMALRGKLLYVADMDRLAVVDVEKGVLVDIIRVDGAKGLNDVTMDENGMVYVTDSQLKRLYQIQPQTRVIGLLAENLKGPNGVHFSKGAVYFLDDGSLFRLQDTGKVLISTGKPGVGDGLESVGGGEYVVSYWPGVIDYVKADGSRETLLDTSAEKISSADLGYDAKKRIVYVPTFFKNSVVAYQLK